MPANPEQAKDNRRFTARHAMESHYRIVDGMHVAFDRWPPPALERIVKAEEAASSAAVAYITSGAIDDEIAFRRALVQAERVWREAAASPPPPAPAGEPQEGVQNGKVQP